MENLAKIHEEWTQSVNKIFEVALAEFRYDTPDRWHRIAEIIPGRTPMELEEHYNNLVEEITATCHRKIKLPKYTDESTRGSAVATKKNVVEVVRTSGTSWTEEEHMKFLEGLYINGKGRWKKIANHVKTRNHAQVASHAQKYFVRQEKPITKRRRPSILDITLNPPEKAYHLTY